jgi:hypothetical protein
MEPSLDGTADESSTSSALTPATTDASMGHFDEGDLRAFIAWPEDKHWSGFIKLDNKTYSN